jgi:hypothetical protein
LDVCIGSLDIAFGGISISWDIHIEINVNIFIWMFRYLICRIDIIVECQIMFGWLKWCIAFVWEYEHATCLKTISSMNLEYI